MFGLSKLDTCGLFSKVVLGSVLKPIFAKSKDNIRTQLRHFSASISKLLVFFLSYDVQTAVSFEKIRYQNKKKSKMHQMSPVAINLRLQFRFFVSITIKW